MTSFLVWILFQRILHVLHLEFHSFQTDDSSEFKINFIERTTRVKITSNAAITRMNKGREGEEKKSSGGAALALWNVVPKLVHEAKKA